MNNNDEKSLPDAGDFMNIETLKNKYIKNWDAIPKKLQDFIMSCDKYWMNIQEILLYKNNRIVSAMGITRWNCDVTVNSMGAGDLFQWNEQEGLVSDNL